MAAPAVQQKLNIIDVGAYGGTDRRWAGANVMGFDRDCLLFSSCGRTPFYITRSAGCSSLYRPNRRLLDQFPNARRFDVLETRTLPLLTLDSVVRERNMPPAHMLKLDVQGAELEVLKGAGQTLVDVVGVEVEVAFVPLYMGQPLFGSVDAFLREHGFVLMDLNCHYWKRERDLHRRGPGELVAADALYFKQDLLPSQQRVAQDIRRAYGYQDEQTCCTRLASGAGFKVFDVARRWFGNRCLDRPFASHGRLGGSRK